MEETLKANLSHIKYKRKKALSGFIISSLEPSAVNSIG